LTGTDGVVYISRMRIFVSFHSKLKPRRVSTVVLAVTRDANGKLVSAKRVRSGMWQMEHA